MTGNAGTDNQVHVLQVHRAVMVIDGKRRNVAVKVRHPGVDVRIRQDFRLLHPLAAAASKVGPSDAVLALPLLPRLRQRG